MEYSAGTSWLQQQHISDLHDVRATTNDDWKEPSTSMSPGPGTSGPQPSMDLSDFGLDIPDRYNPAPSTSNSTINPSFYFGAHNNYFLTGDAVPYNAPSYRPSMWPASSPAPLPLSSYSTLNGATTAPQLSGPPPQPSSNTQSMMIDPALTMNASSSNSNLHYSTPFLSSQPQQRTQYPYQHSSQASTSSINPSFVHTTPSHYQQSFHRPPPQQLQSPPTQGTLAPYVLHSPSNPTMHSGSSIATSSFYAPTSAVPIGPSPEQLRERFLAGLRPLLQPSSFSGAGAVMKLTNHIDSYGVSKVDATTRIEVLTKIRDNAGNHYFRAWAENDLAMEISKTWLKDSADMDSPVAATTMPLLHILDRLPMTLQCLKSSGIAKELRPFKTASSAAIQDMASNLNRKWRALLPQSQAKSPVADGSIEDIKSKKRKAEDSPALQKGAPSTKKAPIVASGSSTKVTAVKREGKTAATVKDVKDAKSDSSFFSAPKPKRPLPSFKKAPAPVKKELDPNVAQPSSYDPFLEIVKSMKPRKDSPATSTPPPGSSAPLRQTSSTEPTNPLKKKKSVSWAPDGQLELVKLIERAVYDDDPADGMHTAHSVRDLDRSEGAALIAHLFDEQIDWSEPILVEMPPELEVPPRGKDSVERKVQEEREQTALGAVYMGGQIPESAAEPSLQIPEEQVDAEVKTMLTGPDVDTIFWSGGVPAALELPPSSASVAELVGQLAAGSTDVPMGNVGQSFNFEPGILANIGPEQLQQLVQQAQAIQQSSSISYPASQSITQTPRGNGDQDWNSNPYPDYDRTYPEENGRERRWSGDDSWTDRGGSRGRGRGKGRGRGDGFGRGGFGSNKRKPCNFYAQGRCKYGDQCDFSHEVGLTY